ncbi:unnamed protein product (macronuclear) [Paramecium tetraurelia]|uniref:Uncharacterized protein n=1 Tax=Paramecium tetraurelia TaxID=5888 RepID=A0CF13_PARTE|nr:uncharacterized protein GSPATT00037819001 [Paramecium tetraurelia]CAK69380.1 unnamed protein product [Paramecium tetraurelia]|eukprot:XP_001436777.1 hypothetical protein (macronuclear) [Paramecium tetraurelia strain d4-2]
MVQRVYLQPQQLLNGEINVKETSRYFGLKNKIFELDLMEERSWSCKIFINQNYMNVIVNGVVVNILQVNYCVQLHQIKIKLIILNRTHLILDVLLKQTLQIFNLNQQTFINKSYQNKISSQGLRILILDLIINIMEKLLNIFLHNQRNQLNLKWKQDITNSRAFSILPIEAQNYLKKIDEPREYQSWIGNEQWREQIILKE